jgi:hypothetical protein
MTENNEMINLINQARAQAKRDGLFRFFGRNKKIILTVSVVALVATIGFLAFNSFQKSRQEKFSEILHQSLIDQQVGETEKAKENLKKIYDAKSAPSGVWSLASIRYAAFLLEEGKKSEAEMVYQKVHSCKSCDDYIRDLAGLLVVKTWMSDTDEVKKEDLNSRIEAIENSSKILRYYVSEQRALLELQKNNLEKSYQIFDAIAKNPEASPALKARAADGVKIVVSKGFSPIEKK